MGMRTRARIAATAGIWLLAAATPWPAAAADAEVTSDTAAQFYDVRSPTGEIVLPRRRLTTTLGIGAYDLLDAKDAGPNVPDLSFRARLRYDADYAASPGSSDPNEYNSVVPGWAPNVVDLMYGYVEGRRLLHGWLGFKIGRQYMTDVLGWWAFDGAETSVTTPYFVRLVAYGGFEERGGLPLSTPRFEEQGLWAGNRSGYDPLLYPPFQAATLAPAFGVALESAGVTWIHGRLSYRRVYDTGGSNLTYFASGLSRPASYDGTRMASEKVGYSFDAAWAGVGAAKGGLVYDLYDAEVTSLYGSLDGFVGRRVTVSADYDYYVPTYDADSIWNVFATEPMNDVGVRANVDVSDRLAVSGGAELRVFGVQTSSFDPGVGAAYSPYPNYLPGAVVYPTNGHPMDEDADVGARYHTGETTGALRSSAAHGQEGDRLGADLSAQRTFETRYTAGARVGLWQWSDKLQPDRDATSFQYVLTAGYRFAPRARGSIEWEHDINRLVGQRFRLLLMLTLAVTK